MTEQAVLDRSLQPDAVRQKEQIQPNDIHRFLSDAIRASQGNTWSQFKHTSESLGNIFASHVVGKSVDGKSAVYLGSRKVPGKGRVYGLIDGRELSFDEKGKLQEKQSGNEKVYHTPEEIAQLLGDEAEQHAARILWRLARDKNALPEDIIRKAGEIGLASIASYKKGEAAVVFIPDPQTGKMIRFFTEKPRPTEPQQRESLVKSVRELVADPAMQQRIKSKSKGEIAVDIKRERGEASISKGDVIVSDFAARDDNGVLIEVADKVGEIEMALNPRYIFPDKARVDQEPADADTPTPVLLTGWSMGGNTKTAELYGQALANRFGKYGIIMDTIAEQLTDDSLYKEAESVANYLQSQGLKRVAIIGHSQGGKKALYTALILQERAKERARFIDEGANPEEFPEIPEVAGVQGINIRGLVGQKSGELAWKFGWDSLVKTTGRAAWEATKSLWNGYRPSRQMPGRASQAGIDIAVKGVGGKIERFGFAEYKRRLKSEIAEMASVSEEYLDRMSRLEVPVGFIFGKNDKVSDLAAVTQVSLGYEGMSDAERDKAIKDAYFPNASHFHVEEMNNLGGLHGLPLFDPDAVADMTYKMVKR